MPGVGVQPARQVDGDAVPMVRRQTHQQRDVLVAQRPRQTAAEQAIDEYLAVRIGLGREHLAAIERAGVARGIGLRLRRRQNRHLCHPRSRIASAMT